MPRLNSETLTGKQAAAIRALLLTTTHKQAAVDSGVSISTLDRWLKQPMFRKKLQAARFEMLDHALTTLTGSLADAVDALRRATNNGNANVEIKAAAYLFELTLKTATAMESEVLQLKYATPYSHRP